MIEFNILQITYIVGAVAAFCLCWSVREPITHALDGDAYKISFTFFAAATLWPLFFIVAGIAFYLLNKQEQDSE